MQVNESAPQIKDLIERSSKFLLVTRENPTLDGLYSILALNSYLAALGKSTTLVAGELGNLELAGQEQFVSQIPPRNLVISFDYAEGSIEKVSYSTEGSKFNLVITPRNSGFNPESINYSYSGEVYDVIFVIDVPEMPLIANTCLSITSDLPNSPVVNIDHTQINSLYGLVNCVDVEKSSTSEIIMEILTELGSFEKNEASLVYQGIKAATQNFSVGVSSETLDSAANCMRVIEGKKTINREEHKTNHKKEPSVNRGESSTPDSSWLTPKIFRSSQVN